MRSPDPFAICVLISAGVAACSSSTDDGRAPDTTIDCSAATTNQDQLECRVFELVNQVRAQGAVCGTSNKPPVAPLALSSILHQTARAHAEDMAQNNYFDHVGLDGRTPFDRIEQAGYQFSAAGENLAAGSATAEETMQQWMQSPGHCENVMSDLFVDIGCGYAFSAANPYQHLWVQNFGAPL